MTASPDSAGIRPLRELSAAACLERWAGRPVDLLEVLLTLSFACETPDEVLHTVTRMCDAGGWGVLVVGRGIADVSFYAAANWGPPATGAVDRAPGAVGAAVSRARRSHHRPSLVATGMAQGMLRWPSVARALVTIGKLYRVADEEVERDPALRRTRLLAERDPVLGVTDAVRAAEQSARRRARARLVPLYANTRVVGL